MSDADSPFFVQLALLFALVAVAVLILQAWLPTPETSDVSHETDTGLVQDG